ncbi:MAG: hypothetical protein ACI9OS_002487, partial [Ulvibacter sp.]
FKVRFKYMQKIISFNIKLIIDDILMVYIYDNC